MLWQRLDGNEIRIQFQPEDSADVRASILKIIEAAALHSQKARDYAGAENELGVKAQFVDMNRKWVKVKRSLWDGNGLIYEDIDEVLQDMIGHIGITLRMLAAR